MTVRIRLAFLIGGVLLVLVLVLIVFLRRRHQRFQGLVDIRRDKAVVVVNPDWEKDWPVPFKTGDRVRCLTIFNSTCGELGTVVAVLPCVSIPRRILIRFDGVHYGNYVHEHMYHPPPFGQSLELEHPARYTPTFTREVESLLEAAILAIPGFATTSCALKASWDLTATVLALKHQTGVSSSQIVSTLCRLIDHATIVPYTTTFWGGPYQPAPTRLRPRRNRLSPASSTGSSTSIH